MAWLKLGLIWSPPGNLYWARNSFMTPVPLQISSGIIRIFGGIRDDLGVSRIGWIDVKSDNPTQVVAVCDCPCLDIGSPGMFDDNGVILGDIIYVSDRNLRLYYVGFQKVDKAKFLAFTGVAESQNGGFSFERLRPTPILDRSPNAPFINALHSIIKTATGYRAWIACGQRWEIIEGVAYPQYDCWTVDSSNGIDFDMRESVKCLDVSGDEYRIGRPRVNVAGSSYELRVTSDTRSKLYSCHLATSIDGINFTRSEIDELPRGRFGDWDGEMTCYPAYIKTMAGETYLFYNGNGMGKTGVGVAKWIDN